MSDINGIYITSLTIQQLQDLELDLVREMSLDISSPVDNETLQQNALQLDLVRSVLHQRFFYMSFNASKKLNEQILSAIEKQNHILEEMSKTLSEIQLYVRSANKKLG